MKKKTTSNPLKTFNDNKAKAYMKAGGAMKAFKKSLPKAQLGQQTEYDRNIKRSIDADKELQYVTNLPSQTYSDQKVWNKVYGQSPARLFEYAPNYLGVRSPYATDADMAAYDKEIAAFYKKNPNIKPYVGTLKTKPAMPIEKKGGVVKKKKK